jgi:hypothetical protein
MFFNFLVGPDIAVLFSMIASFLVTELFTKMVLLMFVMVWADEEKNLDDYERQRNMVMIGLICYCY